MTLARLLDANANRAAEAARTLEDAARFLLDDARLSGGLKSLRHDLTAALRALPPLEGSRSAATDVGAEIATPGEARRDSTYDVASAAAQRLQQALRVLEEFAKASAGAAPEASRELEQLRYRAYDLGRDVLVRLGSKRRRQWRVCVLLTESACLRPWERVLAACVDGGADCIQVREKGLSDAALLDRVRRVIDRAREAPAPPAVVVNDRLDVALAAGADGVHLGQDDLPAQDARRLAGRELLVGVSTSHVDEARAAVDAGADVVGLGPMFASTTKGKPVLAGPAYLRAYLAGFRLPHLAIGGIDAGRARDLRGEGARGVAVSAAVCGADDPEAAVREVVGAMSTEAGEKAPPGEAGS
ncbi:MAG: thiamine phosphate synthase [Planctomycetota bacterium]